MTLRTTTWSSTIKSPENVERKLILHVYWYIISEINIDGTNKLLVMIRAFLVYQIFYIFGIASETAKFLSGDL